MTAPATGERLPDFSLVLGGPLFQLLRRARLSGPALELLPRRLLVLSGVAWVPLLIFSAFAGQVRGGTGLPFFSDIEAHVKFLFVLPVLIAAEVIVDRRLRSVVAQFVSGHIVVPKELPEFREAINSTLRARNSIVAEAALLLAVYTLGLWVFRYQVDFVTSGWYGMPSIGRMHWTPAGYWYAFVSTPLFQFILLRSYFRFALWFRFLRRVSKLNLRLLPNHPDKAAGLGFLTTSLNAFSSIPIAQSALMSALLASLVLHSGRNLLDFKLDVVFLLAFFLAVLLSPLFVFIPNLVRAKRQGLDDFGALSSRYVLEFEDKWLHGRSPSETLSAGGDIQSLADLASSYEIVNGMRLVPFGWRDVITLVAGIALPLLPLTLTVLSIEELLDRLLKVLL